jgi:hypothetical protein
MLNRVDYELSLLLEDMDTEELLDLLGVDKYSLLKLLEPKIASKKEWMIEYFAQELGE